MDIENIMLGDVSQTEKGKYHIISLNVESTKETNKKHTDAENRLAAPRGEGGGRRNW